MKFRRLLPLLTFLLVWVAAAEGLSAHSAQPALRALGLAGEAERYTALEIVDHLAVRSEMAAGSEFSVRLRITNHEGHAVDHSIETAVLSETGRPLTRPSVQRRQVAAGVAADAMATVRLPSCLGRAKVTFTLVGRAELVQLWVTLAPVGTGMVACG